MIGEPLRVKEGWWLTAGGYVVELDSDRTSCNKIPGESSWSKRYFWDKEGRSGLFDAGWCEKLRIVHEFTKPPQLPAGWKYVEPLQYRFSQESECCFQGGEIRRRIDSDAFVPLGYYQGWIVEPADTAPEAAYDVPADESNPGTLKLSKGQATALVSLLKDINSILDLYDAPKEIAGVMLSPVDRVFALLKDKEQ